MNSIPQRARHGALLFVLVLLGVVGCSHSTAVVEQSLPYYVTPASALDPILDDATLHYLLDSSTTVASRIIEKGAQISSFADSLQHLLDLAADMVTTDSSKHIPYVWGGKHLDKPTKWSQPPNSNSECAARIGLDCSGFVQYIFEKAGFGRQAPELNVASLARVENWDFIAKRGYRVLSLLNPKPSDLIPGDVLIFGTGGGNHTGIFWKQDAHLPTGVSPAFINSMGQPSCDSCYDREAHHKPIGVVFTPLGPKMTAQLVSAIRILPSNTLTFGIPSHQYAGDFRVGEAPFVFDSTLKTLTASAFDDTTYIINPQAMSFLFFQAEKVTGVGKFKILERSADSADIPKFWYAGDDGTSHDSTSYQASTPPSWWHGAKPKQTGGEVNILNFSPARERGTIAGTFKFNANTYYERLEDSTYMIDTVKFSLPVWKYYYQQAEVSGRFGGAMTYYH
jgi:hypothetical protein